MKQFHIHARFQKMGARFLTVLCVLLFATLTAAHVSAQAHGTLRPSVGVLRFDAWFQGSRYNNLLAPSEWQSRLPFYAALDESTDPPTVEMYADTQEAMDYEILTASAAGIDYWIFPWYDDWDLGDGFPYDKMNASRRLYHTSQYKARMKFALHVGLIVEQDPDVVAEWIREMQDPQYLTIDGRPVLFYWDDSAYDPTQDYGSWAGVRASLESNLIAPMQQAGLPRPYLVAMTFVPERGAKHYIGDLGFDALSSYATSAPREGSRYGELTAAARKFWDQLKRTRSQVIPHVVTGWDPRPHASDPYYTPPPYTFSTMPRPNQIANHLREAIQWVKRNPAYTRANTIIMYAWNESSEGGWLVPTHAEGTARLDALKRVLR